MILKWLAAVVCGSSALIFVALAWNLWGPSDRGMTAFWLLLFLVAGITYYYCRLNERTRTRAPKYGLPGYSEPLAQSLDRWVSPAGIHKLSSGQMDLFVGCAINPLGHFLRISELVSESHTSIIVESTFSVRVDQFQDVAKDEEVKGPRGDLVVPLIFPRRGVLLNGLRAFGPGDKRISTLPYDDVITFEMAVMRALAFHYSDGFFSAYVSRIEPSVAHVLGAPRDDQEELLEAILEQIVEVAAGQTPKNESAGQFIQTLLDLIARVWNVHPVCVAVSTEEARKLEWPSALRFKIEQRVVRPIDADVRNVKSKLAARIANFFNRRLEHLRLFFGVRPGRIYFEIGNSRQALSYHLQIEGPGGTFLASPGIYGDEAEIMKLKGDLSPVAGQRRLHAYFRQEPKPRKELRWDAEGYERPRRPRRIFVSANFEERSPGSLASPTFSAVAAFVVIGSIALRHTSTEQDSTLGSDLPLIGLLLAVPVAVAAMSGFDVNKDHRRPSMVARAVPLATMVFALVGVLLVILQAREATLDTFNPDQSWLGLTAAAGINVVVAAGSWFGRVRQEHRLMMRSARRGHEQEETTGRHTQP
ncbi:hypothetical protein [Rathayibacter sp. VKM Ac-2928]|uniref:hypothetical protein n=1 Tax=Rathayibacter sp. VKM Ac-2928 TaxID=2929479 RepID=UPI001FB26723|nr:hypothetical protein [Rathayibacter sp. VKM Ac-2928]MCJ1682338.1 hypothetical protein [Rathayibacter sp. VKM Ac-2928]